MEAVEGGDDIDEAGVRGCGGELIEGVGSDGNDLGGVVEMDLLTLLEAVDDVFDGIVTPFLGLGSRPEEHAVTIDVHEFQFAGLLGCIAVNPRHRRHERRIAPVVVAQ